MAPLSWILGWIVKLVDEDMLVSFVRERRCGDASAASAVGPRTWAS